MRINLDKFTPVIGGPYIPVSKTRVSKGSVWSNGWMTPTNRFIERVESRCSEAGIEQVIPKELML